ncbi:DNA helicase-2 / ATP-dependent DNA helicase PcrA [Streptoalloteichus tenebrarius]|uniref:DNA 3'-5' helicase n=1 Tax=Streptoalloteichus tenebrarius (strain ATCC 17920 / DSM 40477 / JCM 4838 / CBS 697.72 / NBRC 16177 / NCIMB 11028 / NRRL B-12390 / A12253. 1 / ISP 5477) TaxID=1933 RepID=A0ABT1HVT5_STRSD|nr:ATP-dependent DNA helicase UvrD2 [Streptoalloteichus tenebrarius]MCP2259639.1 DNA helicase-2 / ATP-dependent DNA helicase PcrA [Streptoalloteichus tenebrarius]BFF00955.1 ATP-dependent DNA helicase UvrD2 [Streptoalloteichus tenebrarius]
MDAGNKLLEGLDPEQRAAVVAPRGPVCVLAGAGTGKTRTITRRIAHLVHRGHVAPGQVLAVTFTARAAGEMRTRLRALGAHGVQARTFHAAALRQLRYFWPRVVDDEPWQLVEHKLRLVGQAAHRVGASTEAESLRDLASEIEWSKASLVTPEDYPAVAARAHRDTPGPPEQVAQVYATYEQLKMRSRVLDFDDLLLHTAAALEEHPDVAGEFRDRYRCFVVDEYQDVTPLQQRVLDAWLGNRDDLTVVGDANQTIYSFAGATPRWLLDFSRRFPEATTVRLERDYRSTPQVVSLANRVIGAARGRPAGARLRLVGQRPPGPEPEFAEYDDEPAEAAAVALRIRKLLDEGVPASEIAVLFRVNAQSEVYEQALAEQDIPYQVRGGERFFARPEVRQAMQALRVAAGAPGEGALDARVRAVLEPLGLTERPPAGGATRERWESLRALVELAEELATALPEADLARFAQELDMRAEAQHPPTVEGVTLASLHAAKGLEWDAVFLVGLVEGTLPIQHADGDDEAVEEERRLLYVGVTRAREFLSLTWALSRSPGGRRHRRRSRFLYGLVPDNHPAALPARGRGRDGAASRASLRDEARRRCRNCGGPLVGTMAVKLGRCADCPSDVDEELLARLRAWRTERARQLKVPAYVVFTDATLTAIAEQRPADEAGLVAIPGIGAAKLDRYGADVIALVNGTFPPDRE